MASKTYTRPYLLRDLPDLATLAATAFHDDEGIAHIWPHRATHPAAFRRWWLRIMKGILSKQGSYCWVVCKTNTNDDEGKETATESEEIVAASVWLRRGPATTSTALAWRQVNNGFPSAIERTLLDWEDKYATLFELSRAGVDKQHLNGFMGGCSALSDKWTKDMPNGHWHIKSLMVAPDYERQGIGGRLLRWGIENGREEGVPVTLNASPHGLRLYERHGFRDVGHVLVGEEQVDYGPFMIWDPE